MTKAELVIYRQKLVALQQRLSGDVSSLAAEALNAIVYLCRASGGVGYAL